MIFDLQLVLAGVILALVLALIWFSNTAEQRRKSDLAQQQSIFSEWMRTLRDNHTAECDRLMARSLGEAKAWQSPEQLEAPKPVDLSWMQPDFSMPEDPRD